MRPRLFTGVAGFSLDVWFTILGLRFWYGATLLTRPICPSSSVSPRRRSPAASPRWQTRYASHPAHSPAPPTPARSVETAHSVPCQKANTETGRGEASAHSFNRAKLGYVTQLTHTRPCKLFQ